MNRSAIVAFVLVLSAAASAPAETQTKSATSVGTKGPVAAGVEPKIVAPAAGKAELKFSNSKPAAPAPSSAICAASRSAAISGARGMGCRETPPSIWKAQGCPATAGCCQAAKGCLVSGVLGDGMY